MEGRGGGADPKWCNLLLPASWMLLTYYVFLAATLSKDNIKGSRLLNAEQTTTRLPCTILPLSFIRCLLGKLRIDLNTKYLDMRFASITKITLYRPLSRATESLFKKPGILLARFRKLEITFVKSAPSDMLESLYRGSFHVSAIPLVFSPFRLEERYGCIRTSKGIYCAGELYDLCVGFVNLSLKSEGLEFPPRGAYF